MENSTGKRKDPAENHSYKADFVYKTSNPYSEKLEIFNDFVMKDNEAEQFRGKWNSEVFKREAAICCEIGTGYGHFMHEYCQKNPEVNFVGLDYRFKRSFNLARKLNQLEHKNFKYLRAKGERVSFIFGESELKKMFYFFPDPWPKTRHHKKRLFQKPFLEACYKVLDKDGILFVKTDHDGYFQWMLNELKEQELFETKLLTWDLHKEHPEHFLAKYITKFEKIFMQKGITTKALVLKSRKS